MDGEHARAFAKSWIDGWNQRDAEAVLSHYSDDVEFQSLLVRKLMGTESGTVRGKQQLREYFGIALGAFPGSLAIELLGVFQGVDSMAVHFQAGGRKAVEIMELDQEGKVHRAVTLSQI